MGTRFHEYLTLIRKSRGYTQAQMAEKLGISRSTYTNYESGNRSPDLETLEKIREILDCSMDELFGRVSAVKRDIIREAAAPYQVNVQEPKKKKYTGKRLAIGVQDFRFLRERNSYYVDKTQMIEEFLESVYQITLVTRPRRFGKTMNMSMLAEFLDCTKNSGDIFAGTKIADSYIMEEMNQHPVISLSFLNVRGDTVEAMLYKLIDVLQREYERYSYVFKNQRLPDEQTERAEKIYESLRQKKMDDEGKSCISDAVFVLCQVLELYYDKKVYLLLDEYDTPFIAANAEGYYDELREVLAGLLRSSLKGNPSLEKAMLTGIQRVAKENIFSGMNNLAVCTVKDPEYADCFGFSEEEVRELLEYHEMEFSDAVRAMYDGYLFGTEEVYNPWSVTCYAARKKLESYWVNTGENSIIKNALEQRGESFAREYNKLIEKGAVTVNAELSTAYYENPDDASLWGLLINAGMVTIQEEVTEGVYNIRIPNQEVWKAFQDLTAFYLQVEEGHINMMLYNLRTEDMESFAEDYQWILMNLLSYHDLKSENSYHMMMLGMCAFLHPYYEIKSNQENGTGRGDILLYARKPELPHMILEFKYTKEQSQNLEELALEAIEQAKEKKYDSGMDGTVYYIGLAHYGKSAEIRWEKKLAGIASSMKIC